MINLTVFKYPIKLDSDKNIRLPTGYKILHAGMQKGQLCLWVLIDEDVKTVEYVRICVIGTGHMVPANAKYISTVQDGIYVWHIFAGA